MIDFPEVLLLILQKQAKYYVFQFKSKWQKIEDLLFLNKELLAYACEELFSKSLENEALSLIERNNLIEFICSKTISEKFYNKDYIYIENLLFTEDKFCPTEYIFKGNKLHFLCLEEFGIFEKDVFFIENENEENFDFSIKTLLNSKTVGLDSEFANAINKFDLEGIAIFQISNEKNVFIYDMLSLRKSHKFFSFLKSLFNSKEIVKVGQGISQDFDQLLKTIHLDEDLELNNYFDLQSLFKYLNPNTNLSNLSYIVEQTVNNRTISKYEQISNWTKRPLRKTQLHYAAMDSFICIEVLKNIKKIFLENNEIENLEKIKQNLLISPIDIKEEINEDENEIKEKKEKFYEKKKDYSPNKEGYPKKKMIPINKNKGEFQYSENYKHFFEDKSNLKFLVDNMLLKLAKYLRNYGIDAEFMAAKDHEQLAYLAENEKRIIITTDKKFFGRKWKLPTYLLNASAKTEEQFIEVKEYFQIELDNDLLLTRCTKCNGNNIDLITHKEAKSFLNWGDDEEYEKITDYWQCKKCKQIYWEGHTFKNAVNRFQNLIKK